MEIRTNKESEATSRDSSVSSTSSRARSVPGSREPSAPKDVLQTLAARGMTFTYILVAINRQVFLKTIEYLLFFRGKT